MKLFIGNRKVTEEEQTCFFSKIKQQIGGSTLKKGDVLVCKAQTQYGIIAEWKVCQKMGLIPFFIAPDYNVEHSDFMKYSDAEYCLMIDGKEEIQFERIKKGTGAHLSIGNGSVIHMTSATSGKPKFIVRSKEQLQLEVKRYCERLQLTKEDVILSIAPFFHAYAFLCPMLGAIFADAALIQPDILMPRNVIELCKNQKVTCIFGIPYFFDKMAETDKAYMLYEKTRYVISSGEKLTKETAKKFKDRFGIALNQQYGSTETGTITFSDSTDPYECQGKPIPGVEFCIEKKDGKNHVLVNTHGTMGAYIKEQITPIADGFYATNDLGYFDEEGRLFIEGRADDIVVRAGEKINIREVASVIEKMPGIEGVKIEVGTDTLKEMTCFYNADREYKTEEFLDYCKRYLSGFQIPRHFIKSSAEVGQKQNWKHNKK